MSDVETEAACEITVRNPEGLHARPVMRFVDLASTFQARISVSNLSGRREVLDGKSAMQMILLEATHGAVLRIEATGPDAQKAVRALADLIESGLDGSHQAPS